MLPRRCHEFRFDIVQTNLLSYAQFHLHHPSAHQGLHITPRRLTLFVLPRCDNVERMRWLPMYGRAILGRTCHLFSADSYQVTHGPGVSASLPLSPVLCVVHASGAYDLPKAFHLAIANILLCPAGICENDAEGDEYLAALQFDI